MNHEPIVSILFYICGCFYMVFGASILAANAKSPANRLFLFLTSSLAIWSFSYSISNAAPTAEASAFWRSFSVFGWGVYSSLLLHFIVVLTGFSSRLKRRSMYLLLYLPALINIILFGPLGIFVEKQYIMVQTNFGWMNAAPVYAASIWLNSYYVVFSLASLVLLILWWRNLSKSSSPVKRQARFFIVSILLLFFIETFVDMLPDILNKKFFPKSAVVFLLIPTIMLFSLLRKTGLIRSQRRKLQSLPDITREQTETRLRLFKTVTVIFLLGSSLSFLVGYFSMKRSLEHELLLAGSLLVMGIALRLLPVLTRNQTVQNNLFLAISTFGLLYFMVKDAQTAALTIWGVYILFLLFTVILDSPIHANIFVAISVIVQIVFWIFHPVTPVIIDGNEYVTRIIIIILSFVTVRYLTAEYASKIRGYQGLAREQEVLEKISSSFIAVNSENVREKINETMEMAVEILEFSQAYLIEFSSDCEDATILCMYEEDDGDSTCSYQPGMHFKTTELPLFRSLIEHNEPFICEDTARISFVEGGAQKEYFTSRGVRSFFALPITADEKTAGVLVAEYANKLESAYAQSRLNVLQIITNILGDARKKILYEERLYSIAYFDDATKLANRNMLKRRLDQLISSNGGSGKAAIIDLELENLRVINDTFGHGIGEQIMIKSATILKQFSQECGVISRAGTGGFVVVLPDVKSREQIETFAKKLLSSFSHPVATSTGIEALFVSVLIGISVYPDDGRDAETLLKNADLARFEAENTNEKIVFYTERLGDQIAENTVLTNRLYRALENREFFLEFQPQICCKTGKTAGAEALLRWTSDGKQRVSPDRFIPILEQTGLIHEVGLWVLEDALREHRRLIAKGLPPLRISVNLSVVQFQGEGFIRDFVRIIKESGVYPKYLELEITESFFSKNPEQTLEKLRILRESGVRIAIDDFGKGYSSLSRLKRIPFDRIKIDKDIISHIDVERRIAPITEVTISLAKTFGASITAEGVETKEQADFLKSIFCDEIQGYYYSRPLSAEALEEHLKKERQENNADRP